MENKETGLEENRQKVYVITGASSNVGVAYLKDLENQSGAKLVFENGLDSGYRYVGFKNYLVFYRLRPNNIVYVDRVIYGGRDYMRILFPGL